MVSAGRMRFRRGARRILAAPAPTVIVPHGTVHRFSNAGDEEARVRVEVRPALRTTLYARSRGWPSEGAFDAGTRRRVGPPRDAGEPGGGMRAASRLGGRSVNIARSRSTSTPTLSVRPVPPLDRGADALATGGRSRGSSRSSSRS